MNSPRYKLLTLEAGRFFASVAVMFMHYTNAIKETSDIVLLDNIFLPGHMGVPYFFVLSGFIIYHIHGSEIGDRHAIPLFLKKRVIRIYPIFILVSLPMLIGFLITPSLGQERHLNFWGVSADLLLLPHANAILSISWTLRHEIVFYALFAFALAFGPRGFIAIAVWIGISLFGSQWPEDQGSLGLWSIVGNPLNMGFGLGILSAAAVRRFPDSRAPYLGVAGLLGLVSLWLVEWICSGRSNWQTEPLGHAGAVAMLLSSAVLIYGLVQIEQRRPMPWAKAWSVLGGSSYTLYLIHQPLGSVALRVFPHIGKIPPLTAFVLMSSTALLIAVTLHMVLERPLLRYLRKFIE